MQEKIVLILFPLFLIGAFLLMYFQHRNVVVTKSSGIPSPSLTISPSQERLSEALPPLYSGLDWNSVNTGYVSMITGYVVQPKPSDITSLGQNANQFFYIISQPIPIQKRQNVYAYYEDWFREHQWKEDVIADGPTGSAIGFLKNGNRFLINLLYLMHNTSQYTVYIEHN